jgi:hypothetical protein
MVVGMPLREARRAVEEAVDAAGQGATLRVEVVIEYSSEARGTVLASGPAAGVELESGGTVRLTVAEPLPAMPNLVGMAEDRARREIENLGFTVRTKQQVSSSAARGTVLSQSVAPGEQVNPDEVVVVLTLAKPPPLTISQEQAIAMAEDYLDYMPFSESGLVEQLEYEGFSTADAQFAVNHIHVNWNEQAAAMAEDYLDYMPFSRAGLIEQLEYEGFTTAQATYGVNQAGL